jgi:integrase
VTTKIRGVLWRKDPKGSQTQPGTKVKGDWWVSYMCALRHRHREKIGPKALAREEHAKRRVRVRTEGYCPRIETGSRPVLFEDAAEDYLAWSKVQKKSWRTDEHWLTRLKASFSGKVLEEITPEAVGQFKLKLAETRTKATVNRHLALLRHLFNRLIRQEAYAGRNPVPAVGLFPEENARTRWLTLDEEKKLFAVIPEPYRSFCRVALYTGCRRSELLAARWDFLDSDRGLLTPPTSKSGKPRHIELSSLVLETLAGVSRRLDTPLIFPGCRKVTHRFPKWVKDAKLPEDVTLHTLRHSFASRLVMAGVDLLTVKDLGGWGDLAMVQRYAHLAPAHRREAVEALARGERLQRSGTQSGTSQETPSEYAVAGVG